MPAPFRVIQLSDTHLSATRAYTTGNFDRLVDWINGDPPALVINTGDLVLDDPDDEGDRAFAHAQHGRIEAPVAVVPGNHDVGDSGPEPYQGQPVTRRRRDAFLGTWGADRFRVDLGAWRLLGIDNLLLGEAALADEAAEQLAWLRANLAGAEQVALFMHKPLCHARLDVEDPPGWSVPLAARAPLWELLRGAPVRFIASGHLHRHRSSLLGDGVAAVWGPSAGYIAEDRFDGALRRCGLLEYVFDGPTVRWAHRELPGLDHVSSAQLRGSAPALRVAPLRPYRPPTPS